MVKSTCPKNEDERVFLGKIHQQLTLGQSRNVPGVSIKLMRCFFHGIVIAADVMVMPRSRS